MQGVTHHVTGYLKIMEVGQVVLLHPKTNEGSIRNVCSRLKKEGKGVWVCEKKFIAGSNKLQGFRVKRLA